MSNADEQIRVTEDVKTELKRRRREDERLTDVVARLLEEDRDLLAGWGAFGDTDRAETLKRVSERGDAESRDRVEKMADRRSEE